MSEFASLSARGQQPSSPWRVIASCMMGNALEWYDFMLFTQLLTFVSACVMPPQDSASILNAGFFLFFVGFITRPLGALFFGYLGDVYHSSKVLLWAIYAMTFATLGIGLMPSYATAGYASMGMLMVCRALQGLAMGGEFSSAMITLVQYAPPGRKSLWGSFVTLSALLGVLMGCAMCWLLGQLLTLEQLRSWGWRLPFLLSALGGVAGSSLRRHMAPKVSISVESTENALSQDAPQCKPKEAKNTWHQWRHLLRQHQDSMWRVILIDAVVAVGFFLITTYIFNALLRQSSIAYGTLVQVNAVSMGVFACTIPLAGMLSDRWTPQRVMMWGCVVLGVLAVPCFVMLQGRSVASILLGHASLAGAMGLIFGPLPGLLVYLFPRNIRYTGLSLAHNLTMSVLGGMTPGLAALLIQETQWVAAPGILLAAAAFISLRTLSALRSEMFFPEGEA